MLPFEKLEKSVGGILRAKKTFEELYYTTLPRVYNNTTMGVRGFTDEIEPFIRKATLNLSKGMDDDESVVYNNDKKEALIVKKKDVSKYVDRNPTKPVVIENCESGEVVILRRRTNDSRLKHNRSK
jgi:ATP-dependent Lon protease